MNAQGTQGAQALTMNPLAGSLRERAMIFSFGLRGWGAERKDKVATQKVQNDAGAQQGTGRYTKLLVPRHALEPIKHVDAEIRGYVRTNTCLWDTGRYLVPTMAHAAFTQGWQHLTRKRDHAVRNFAGGYPVHVEQARKDLGDLFNMGDYPRPEAIQDLFGVKAHWEPFPDSLDFRVDLPPEELQRIRDDLERDVQLRLDASQSDLWRRLYEVVQAMAVKLSIPAGCKQTVDGEEVSGTFRDSLVSNVREVVRVVPMLNIRQDPALAAMVAEAKARLTFNEADVLRDNAAARQTTAQAANDILRRLSGFVGSVEPITSEV